MDYDDVYFLGNASTRAKMEALYLSRDSTRARDFIKRAQSILLKAEGEGLQDTKIYRFLNQALQNKLAESYLTKNGST